LLSQRHRSVRHASAQNDAGFALGAAKPQSALLICPDPLDENDVIASTPNPLL
jgi:hypothetical protein